LKRREALKNLALTVPASFILPSLAGCSNDDGPGGSFNAKVVIIGAGAAGLRAASLLHSQGIEVQILEASATHGGRIQNNKERLSDFPLELGADEILGSENSWYKLTADTGVPLVQRLASNSYVLDGNVGTLEDYQNDTDFQLARGFRDSIPGYTGSDVTVQNAIQSSGINQRVYHIMEGEIGNQYGSSNDRIGMRGLASAQRAMVEFGDSYVVEDQSHFTIISSVFSDVIPFIRYNSPVTSIDYSGAKTMISLQGGEIIEANKVIVTVPITILQEGSISFTPSLPGSKLNALNNIGMDAGMKVFIRFNGNFWGSGIGTIISDGLVPRYYAPGIGRSEVNNILAGYIMGSKAETLRALSEQEIYTTLLGELDALYNGNASRLVSLRDDAIEGVIKDWANEPYIKGAYSYPKVGAALSRETIALPVNKTLFFAGEATSTNGNFGTVQGALDSAERAVSEILEVLAEENIS